MKFSRGQNVFYNARSGKVYPASVLEIKRSLSRGFFISPDSFYYVIEVNSCGISKEIMCTESELEFNEETSGTIKAVVSYPNSPVPAMLKRNKIRKS